MRWLEPALASDQEIDPLGHADAFHVATLMAGWTNQPEKAMAYAEAGVEIGKSLDEPFCLGRACYSTWR